MEEQFQFFKRVSIKNLDRISEKDLIEKLKGERQALCILNTKKRTQKVYQELKADKVYHLSTSMYPIHRKRILGEIRKQLQKKEKCIVISTSLVEAGIDLDFCAVYRQVAGIDSIVQAAGRCNREGKRSADESITYVFQLDEREYVPGQRNQMEVTEMLLEDGKNPEELETIKEYFENLYYIRGDNLDKKDILKAFDGGNLRFADVGESFKLIEENTKTVFIPKEERAVELLNEVKNKGITKKLMREMGQYCVNVYQEDFNKMFGAGMLKAISEDMKDFFELTHLENYTEETGLILEVQSGKAIIC